MKRKERILDLQQVLTYFDTVSRIVDRIYPKELEMTWENIHTFPIDLGVKHPNWIRAHFPMLMIYHREKAGKLRNSKSESVMYQNQNNVLTQLVMTPDEFGAYHRKNKHKGFSNIIGAIQADDSFMVGPYVDKQKPKKYRDFEEFRNLFAPDDLRIKALCEVLQENYPCDSAGQTRLFE